MAIFRTFLPPNARIACVMILMTRANLKEEPLEQLLSAIWWPSLFHRCPTYQLHLPPEMGIPKALSRRFRKEVGGRGLATDGTQNTAKNVPQNCVLLLRGIGKRGEKRPQFMVWEGFLCANPLRPPTPFRNFWLSRETTDNSGKPRVSY